MKSNLARWEPPLSSLEQLVLGDILDPIRISSRITVRNLRPGEQVPFVHGCESFPALDPEWCWVAVQQGQVRGILIGAGMHGVFFILRMVVPPSSPPTTVLVLLRQAQKAVLRRGIRAWITFLMPLPATPVEEKLLRVARYFHVQVIPAAGAWLIGRV